MQEKTINEPVVNRKVCERVSQNRYQSRARKTEHMRSRQMCHARPRWCSNRGIAWHTEWLLINVRYMNSKRSPSSNSKGHFRVPLSLCIKTRLSAQPYDMEMIFSLMQIKLIFTRKVEHLASFSK